jgi:polysaccharide export outer membrane protein
MQSLERPRRTAHRYQFAVLAGLLAALGLSGCGTGSYVWIDDLTDPSILAPAEGAYIIASGDLLNVRVYNQETISVRGRVGPDGKIAIPLVGEIDARGARPAALAKQIETRLLPFIVAPSVTITIEEVQPVRISVLGEVAHPGVFTITPSTGLLQALALAGGITEYADRDRIFVLRPRPAKGLFRIRLTYQNLTRGLGRSAKFALESGDTVVVE